MYDYSKAILCKSNDNKTVTEPMVEIINVMNDYSHQKRERNNNLIIFGVKVEKDNDLNKNVEVLMKKLVSISS